MTEQYDSDRLLFIMQDWRRLVLSALTSSGSITNRIVGGGCLVTGRDDLLEFELKAEGSAADNVARMALETF